MTVEIEWTAVISDFASKLTQTANARYIARETA